MHIANTVIITDWCHRLDTHVESSPADGDIRQENHRQVGTVGRIIALEHVKHIMFIV